MKTYKTLILEATLASTFFIGSAAHADTTQDMYHLYNPNSGEHHKKVARKPTKKVAREPTVSTVVGIANQ